MAHGMRKIIGDGSNTSFWYDPWLSPHPLKRVYPRLYSITINLYATVASHGFWEGLNWVWSFSWRRALRPRDVEEKASLDTTLSQVCPSHQAQDQHIWAFTKSGSFSTKSFTLELDKLHPPLHQDAVKGVWKGLVPHRIEVFVWIALMGKINTRSKLASIGLIAHDCNVCALCE